MAMYEVPSGPRRLPVEHLPIDVPSATLTPDLDVVVDGEVVGSVEDAELAQLASSGVTPVVAVDGEPKWAGFRPDIIAGLKR